MTLPLSLASALEKSIAVLDALKHEHDMKEADRRFEKNVPCSSLLDLVFKYVNKIFITCKSSSVSSLLLFFYIDAHMVYKKVFVIEKGF